MTMTETICCICDLVKLRVAYGYMQVSYSGDREGESGKMRWWTTFGYIWVIIDVTPHLMGRSSVAR